MHYNASCIFSFFITIYSRLPKRSSWVGAPCSTLVQLVRRNYERPTWGWLSRRIAIDCFASCARPPSLKESRTPCSAPVVRRLMWLMMFCSSCDFRPANGGLTFPREKDCSTQAVDPKAVDLTAVDPKAVGPKVVDPIAVDLKPIGPKGWLQSFTDFSRKIMNIMKSF